MSRDERSPLVKKNTDHKLESREFQAFESAKTENRKHIFYSSLVPASFIILLICLLVTPLGCIASSCLVFILQSTGGLLFKSVLGYDNFQYPDVSATLNSPIALSDSTLRIVLLGDSLINRPYEMHNLGGKIQRYLSQYDFTFDIVNCGFNGARAAHLKTFPLINCTLPLKPHAVMLFWDSDCSDVSEYKYSDDEVTAIRASYVADVKSIVGALVDTGAYVALAGVGVLGEGKKLFAPHSDRFIQKESMLNTYNKFNENIANTMGVPFIDVRKAFLSKVPFYQLCYKHCVTYDGEHENNRGADIVAKLFADSLSYWLTSSSS